MTTDTEHGYFRCPRCASIFHGGFAAANPEAAKRPDAIPVEGALGICDECFAVNELQADGWVTLTADQMDALDVATKLDLLRALLTLQVAAELAREGSTPLADVTCVATGRVS